jgi:hypothetical protein
MMRIVAIGGTVVSRPGAGRVVRGADESDATVVEIREVGRGT